MAVNVSFVTDREKQSRNLEGGKYPLPIYFIPENSRGRDSAIGIATRYGLDGPEIESR
jgi:hypothetical protein